MEGGGVDVTVGGGADVPAPRNQSAKRPRSPTAVSSDRDDSDNGPLDGEDEASDDGDRRPFEGEDEPLGAAIVEPETAAQWASLTHKHNRDRTAKFAAFEACTWENRAPYFNTSCRPITKHAEDDMELLSDIVTWGEKYLGCWDVGTYRCARCLRGLYESTDKWNGPCAWPSWRKAIPGATATRFLKDYNGYTCSVAEVYCSGCDLFLGHQFEDAKAKGDTHPEARWRH